MIVKIIISYIIFNLGYKKPCKNSNPQKTSEKIFNYKSLIRIKMKVDTTENVEIKIKDNEQYNNSQLKGVLLEIFSTSFNKNIDDDLFNV